MSQPTPPILDRSARLEGHRKSLELRRKRAEIKRFLSDPAFIRRSQDWFLKPTDRFIESFDFKDAQGMKVRDLLLALPYIGPVKARALLAAAGIPEGNTVRACGPKQTERLFALLNK